MITRGARDGLSELEDRREVEERYQAASKRISEQKGAD
jgi:hypothetical protein